jgi:hypothetical protein
MNFQTMNFQDIESELAKLGLELPNNFQNYDITTQELIILVVLIIALINEILRACVKLFTN